MLLLYSLLILFFPFLFLLYFLIFKITVRSALNRFVIPKLEEKGLIFLEYTWTGLFDNGDFKNENTGLTIMSKYGSSSSSIYVFIYYKDLDLKKRVTIRIDTFVFFIKRVVFSSDI
jgi:hypothetical protein